MTEVHRYWTNRKEPVLEEVVDLVEVVVAAVEVEVEVEVAVAAERVARPDWEDCSRLECRS